MYPYVSLYINFYIHTCVRLIPSFSLSCDRRINRLNIVRMIENDKRSRLQIIYLLVYSFSLSFIQSVLPTFIFHPFVCGVFPHFLCPLTSGCCADLTVVFPKKSQLGACVSACLQWQQLSGIHCFLLLLIARRRSRVVCSLQLTRDSA